MVLVSAGRHVLPASSEISTGRPGKVTEVLIVPFTTLGENISIESGVSNSLRQDFIHTFTRKAILWRTSQLSDMGNEPLMCRYFPMLFKHSSRLSLEGYKFATESDFMANFTVVRYRKCAANVPVLSHVI